MKELSLSGHTHSASDITSGTLSVSRDGTGRTSLSSLASALEPYLNTGGSSVTVTTLYSRYFTNSSMGLTYYNGPTTQYDLIIIKLSGSSGSGVSYIYASVNSGSSITVGTSSSPSSTIYSFSYKAVCIAATSAYKDPSGNTPGYAGYNTSNSNNYRIELTSSTRIDIYKGGSNTVSGTFSIIGVNF